MLIFFLLTYIFKAFISKAGKASEPGEDEGPSIILPLFTSTIGTTIQVYVTTLI